MIPPAAPHENGGRWPRATIADRVAAVLLVVRLPLIVGIVLFTSGGRSFSEIAEGLVPGGAPVYWHAVGKRLLDTVTATRITTAALTFMLASMATAMGLAALARRRPSWGFALSIARAACLAAIVACAWARFYLSADVTAALAVNLVILIHLNSDLILPSHLEKVPPRTSRWAFLLLPGVAEACFPVLYARAVLQGLGVGDRRLRNVTEILQGAYLLALTGALWLVLCSMQGGLLQFEAMETYAHSQLPSGCSRVLTSMNYAEVHQIVADPVRPRAFVACSLSRRIAVIDLDGAAPPRFIAVDARIYSVAYDARRDALLYYDNMRDQLVRVRLDDDRAAAREVCGGIFGSEIVPVYDPTRVTRHQFFVGIPPEHVVVRVDDTRRRAWIMSMNVSPNGEPTRLVEVDLDTMREVRASDDLGPPGRESLFDFERRRLYVSYDFKPGVSVFDLDTLQPVGVIPINNHDGQITRSRVTNEIVMADASSGCIRTYDPDTFALRRTIATPRGVRSVAVDDARSVLLADSVLTGTVFRYDLASGALVGSTSGLFPKFRHIVVLPGGGRALVGTWSFVYEVRY